VYGQRVASRRCARGLGLFDVSVYDLEDIHPEGFPLAIALPGVSSLEDGHDVADVSSEDCVEGLCARFHLAMQSRLTGVAK